MLAEPIDAPRPVGPATVAATGTADRFAVKLVADGAGPPSAVRLRHWLKLTKRTHGLRCDGIAPIAGPPSGHLAVTNSAGRWRPRGRAIRAATRPPT